METLKYLLMANILCSIALVILVIILYHKFNAQKALLHNLVLNSPLAENEDLLGSQEVHQEKELAHPTLGDLDTQVFKHAIIRCAQQYTNKALLSDKDEYGTQQLTQYLELCTYLVDSSKVLWLLMYAKLQMLINHPGESTPLAEVFPTMWQQYQAAIQQLVNGKSESQPDTDMLKLFLSDLKGQLSLFAQRGSFDAR